MAHISQPGSAGQGSGPAGATSDGAATTGFAALLGQVSVPADTPGKAAPEQAPSLSDMLTALAEELGLDPAALAPLDAAIATAQESGADLADAVELGLAALSPEMSAALTAAFETPTGDGPVAVLVSRIATAVPGLAEALATGSDGPRPPVEGAAPEAPLHKATAAETQASVSPTVTHATVAQARVTPRSAAELAWSSIPAAPAEGEAGAADDLAAVTPIRATSAEPFRTVLQQTSATALSAAAVTPGQPAQGPAQAPAFELPAAAIGSGWDEAPEALAALQSARPVAPPVAPVAEAAQQAQQTAPTLPTHVAQRIRTAEVSDGKIRIELAPHGIGELEIEVATGDNGRLSVVLRAESSQVLTMIRQDRDTLLSALAARGIEAEAGDLDFEGFGGDNRQPEPQSPQPVFGALSAEDDVEPVAGPAPRAARSGLDILT